MSENESRQQPDGEQLRESVDEDESAVVDGRASADHVARDLKEKEKSAQEPADG